MTARALATAALIAAAAAPVHAQEPTIATPAPAAVINFAGVVRERGTRLPVAGAVVTVFRTDDPGGFEATTDDDGQFVFRDLPAGLWHVAIEPAGYDPFRTTEAIAADERVDVTYHLERSSYNPYDVTVTARRPRKEVSRTVLERHELEKVPGAAGDPLAVIENMAGVGRSQTAGQIILRGSAPRDTRVFIDGAAVPLLFHFGGLKSVLPMALVDRLELYPGNFSPQYGRAIGGIVDVRIKELRPPQVAAAVDLSLLDLGASLEVPLGRRGGIAIAGRRSHVDAVLPALLPADELDLVTAPRYYDGQIAASYRPAAAHDLRFLLLGADDRLEILFANPADVDPGFAGNTWKGATTFYRALASYRYVPGPRVENLLRLSHGMQWDAFRVGEFLIDLDTQSAQLRDTVRVALTRRLTLSAGVDLAYERASGLVHASAAGPPREGDPADDDNGFDDQQLTARIDGWNMVSPAAFVEAELEPIAGLRLLPGLRVDHFTMTNETLSQPRATARWALSDVWTVKAGVGAFVQTPDYPEINDVFGNPDLHAERALHYSAGLEVAPLPWLSVDVTGFYKDLSNLVSRTDAVVMDGGMTRPLRYDNGGSGRVYGAELLVRHDFAHGLAGWLAYTVSRSQRRDSGAATDRLFDHDQPHILTAVATYVLPRNWQLGARFRLVSGNPDTPVVGAVFDASADRYHPIYGPPGSERLDAFHQLDLRVDKRWVFQGWMMNAYLDVQNVYNRANAEGRSYNFDYSQSKPVRGLPILPILGLRGEL